ncbi:hypothetical protein KDW54_15605 [Burkholderia ambifaria]|uniref:hypothetical protein n=1 Tax=Burkholderia ambifaria TaxID=152480 RepID=UPI001B9B28EF|nr:hypothetical protein [Burkholderia ambifaria]MBR8183825.1 hypothetical protein [Burkholderia ambifaria]
MRDRDERGSAAAHQQGFVNPGSWASGTSGTFYLARSVPAGGVGDEKFHQAIEIKELFLILVGACGIRWHLLVTQFRYNQIASYPMR